MIRQTEQKAITKCVLVVAESFAVFVCSISCSDAERRSRFDCCVYYKAFV